MLKKPFEHFDLSILRIFSHFKEEFLVNAKNVVAFSVILCGANETLEFSLVGRSSCSMFIWVEVKHKAKISLKIAKVGKTKLMYVRLERPARNFFFPNLAWSFECFIRKEDLFIFTWRLRLIFTFIFVFILKMILMSNKNQTKSNKNLLKTSKYFAWLSNMKMVFKVTTNDERTS